MINLLDFLIQINKILLNLLSIIVSRFISELISSFGIVILIGLITLSLAFVRGFLAMESSG